MSEPSTLSAAILTISDTASSSPSTDKTTDTLRALFEDSQASCTWRVLYTQIVPDSRDAIQRVIKEWCGGATSGKSGSRDRAPRPNLLVTAGGTGFASRDITPEAVAPLLDRTAPGFVHAMLAESLEITPFAMMSRPVAGVRGQTVIITLPGSPKAAKENLESILKLLPHACLQAAGQDSRALHACGVKKLEQDAGVGPATLKPAEDPSHTHTHEHAHTHSHAHGHAIPRAHTRPEDRPAPQTNDLVAGPTSRHRSSPFPMLSVKDAVTKILEATPPPRVVSASVGLDLLEHVLAEDVTAAEPVPAFRASIVDGYAVAVDKDRRTNQKGVFPVVAVSHATASGGQGPLALRSDQLARITTGAPLPEGASAVVMVEDTVIRSRTADGREEAEVEVLTDAVAAGENVREVGSDIRQHDTVLRAGEKINPGELGLLASVGRAEVRVYKRPVVGVLSTGDEIVRHERAGPLQNGEVRDCNRPTVLATVRSWGYDIVDLGIAKDTADALEEALRAGLRRADTIITSGGVSMGELDLLKPTLERALGGSIVFGRVSMKPGKPTTVARIPFKTNEGERVERLVFALPGNPASAMVTAGLFVLPSLQRASGELRSSARPGETAPSMQEDESWKAWGYPRAFSTLQIDAKCDDVREEYQRAVAWFVPGEDRLRAAAVTGGQRSSRVASFRGSNALLVLPAGKGVLKKGCQVEVLIMGEVGGGI